jgi:hypothetical protein
MSFFLFTLLFIHKFSYDDRQRSVRCYSNQQWVGTHYYKFNTVQLIFGLTRHMYRMRRASFPLARKHVLHLRNNLFIACQSS